jgi:hypothetical protein
MIHEKINLKEMVCIANKDNSPARFMCRGIINSPYGEYLENARKQWCGRSPRTTVFGNPFCLIYRGA